MIATVAHVIPRRRRGRAALFLFLIAAVLYGSALGYLMLQETQLIFRTDIARADTRPSFAYEQVAVPRPDGAVQFGWRMPTAAAAAADPAEALWVLFLHGNASTIASRMNVAHYARLRALGVNVFAPEYRGYNGLDGVPSEATVAADARAAYDYLRERERVPADRLVIYGWSLGAAIAVGLASQVDVRGVILEGAPASVVDIGQSQYPMFPVRWIIRNPFNAIDKVDRIRAPLLFLHSPEDGVIPFAEGRRLFDAAPQPKTFVEVRGGHIEASEIDRETFYGAIAAFLRTIATRSRFP
ncbi:MAG TPA: alpha/beta hydrolase [Vicinamibacterales bacterium]|nr:alpha/beta hydrolase [Vicinamibacterales bacterium]